MSILFLLCFCQFCCVSNGGGPSENTNKDIIKTQNSFDDGSTIGVGECSAWGYENKAEECIKEAIKSLTDNKLLEYEQHMNDALELYRKCSSAWRGIYENKCKGYNIELSNIPVDDDINTLRNNGHAGRSCNECKYDISVSYALSSIAEAKCSVIEKYVNKKKDFGSVIKFLSESGAYKRSYRILCDFYSGILSDNFEPQCFIDRYTNVDSNESICLYESFGGRDSNSYLGYFNYALGGLSVFQKKYGDAQKYYEKAIEYDEKLQYGYKYVEKCKMCLDLCKSHQDVLNEYPYLLFF